MVDGQGYVWKNKRITEKSLDKPNTGSGKAKITSQNQSTTSTLKLTSKTIDCTVKRVQSKQKYLLYSLLTILKQQGYNKTK